MCFDYAKVENALIVTLRVNSLIRWKWKEGIIINELIIYLHLEDNGLYY